MSAAAAIVFYIRNVNAATVFYTWKVHVCCSCYSILYLEGSCLLQLLQYSIPGKLMPAAAATVFYIYLEGSCLLQLLEYSMPGRLMSAAAATVFYTWKVHVCCSCHSAFLFSLKRIKAVLIPQSIILNRKVFLFPNNTVILTIS
jgi:hypothetical protein